jgi:2-hydroxychromene-2-carboxylate isomerase
MRYLASSKRREKRRRKFTARRKNLNLPHHVDYYHQLDDPYSFLAMQVLHQLSASYQIKLRVFIAGSPNAVDASEPELLRTYALRDVINIAPYFKLDASILNGLPEQQDVVLAQGILASRIHGEPSLELIQSVTTALWAGNRDKLEQLGVSRAALTGHELDAALHQTQKQRKKHGHYLGGTFYYDGEWYWGVDRLNYLEQRLSELGLCAEDASAVVERPVYRGLRMTGANDLVLEYFPSLRSPYTYISMQRVYELVQRTGVQLQMRPVLPMMMRGVPASRQKGAYIMFDSKREAETVFDVPFGNICDPFGEPVNRGHSLFSWAREKGKAQEYYLAFARAAFAEGIDTGTNRGMRYVVEKSGLDWQEALGIIDNNEWQEEYEANRLTMYHDMGVWGVPSFRLTGGGLDPLVAWGADRIWLLEAEINKRATATSS